MYGRLSPDTICGAWLIAEKPVNGTEGPTTTDQTAPPTIPTGSLGVSLSCQHNFSDLGRVECTATSMSQASDAIIEYEWSFDGIAQAGTGDQLVLTSVPAGVHTATVVARETVNGLVSSPQSATFTKAAADGGGGIPLVPIAIGVGIGTLLLEGRAIARRGRAAAAPAALGSPLGSSTGAPSGPPESLSVRPPWPPLPPEPPPVGQPSEPVLPPGLIPPAKPPETLRPPPPQPVAPVQPVPARPRPAPAKRTKPATQTPPVPPRRPTDRRRKEDTIWLEAHPATVRVQGDGRKEAPVQVRALKLVDGVKTDASEEVSPVVRPSHPKIRIRSLAGFCDLAIRGVHAGNAALHVTVTIEGTTPTGKPVQPARIDVTIEPVQLAIEVRAWKYGFLEQTRHYVGLPHMPRDVSCQVDGGPPKRTSYINEGKGPVAHAHCRIVLSVDGQAATRPVELLTDERGRIEFRLPSRLVELYEPDAAELILSPAVEMDLNAEVTQSLDGFQVALDRFEEHLRELPSAAFGPVTKNCWEYLILFLRQLREREEIYYNKLLGAVQLLRAGIVFSDRYRSDFQDQREMLGMATKDAFQRFVDVLTDFVPVASWLIDWTKGEQRPRLPLGGKRYFELPGAGDVLAAIARLARRLPGGKYLVRVLLSPITLAAAAVSSLIPLVLRFLNAVADYTRGTEYENWLLNLFATPPETPAPATREKDSGDEIDQIIDSHWDRLRFAAAQLWDLFTKFLWTVISFLVQAMLIVVKLVGSLVGGAFRSFRSGGAAGTWGEVFEEHLGGVAEACTTTWGAGRDPRRSPAPTRTSVVISAKSSWTVCPRCGGWTSGPPPHWRWPIGARWTWRSPRSGAPVSPGRSRKRTKCTTTGGTGTRRTRTTTA